MEPAIQPTCYESYAIVSLIGFHSLKAQQRGWVPSQRTFRSNQIYLLKRIVEIDVYREIVFFFVKTGSITEELFL